MRDIRFRAWDKKTKDMFSPEILEETNSLCWGEMVNQHNKGQVILMQFTGLLDKNGKEIYEGDILKRNTGYIFEVKLITWISGNRKLLTYDIDKEDEVIGNIYENKDLLNMIMM